MKKYVILSDGNSPHTIRWIKELKKYYEVFLISFNGVSDELREILSNSHIVSLKYNNDIDGGNISVLKTLPRLIVIMRNINPDYINAHYVTSYGTMAVLAKKLGNLKGKIILSAWGTDILVTPFKSKVYFYLTKYLLGNSDFITSDSNYMARKINQICKTCKVITFSFGTDKLPEVCEAEKNYKLFFSNRALEKNYNVDKIIDLFNRIYALDKECILYIAHIGQEKDKLVRYVEDLGIGENVIFLGLLKGSEMEQYYRKCGYYFSIPTSDSTSVSLMEAMSFGCIPIVSKIPANLEWISDGKNGFVFDLSMNIVNINPLSEAFNINRQLILKKGIFAKNIVWFLNKLE